MDKDRQLDFHKRIFETRFRLIDRADYILSLELERPKPDTELVASIGGLRVALYQELISLVDRQIMQSVTPEQWKDWIESNEKNAYVEVEKNAAN